MREDNLVPSAQPVPRNSARLSPLPSQCLGITSMERGTGPSVGSLQILFEHAGVMSCSLLPGKQATTSAAPRYPLVQHGQLRGPDASANRQQSSWRQSLKLSLRKNIVLDHFVSLPQRFPHLFLLRPSQLLKWNEVPQWSSAYGGGFEEDSEVVLLLQTMMAATTSRGELLVLRQLQNDVQVLGRESLRSIAASPDSSNAAAAVRITSVGMCICDLEAASSSSSSRCSSYGATSSSDGGASTATGDDMEEQLAHEAHSAIVLVACGCSDFSIRVFQLRVRGCDDESETTRNEEESNDDDDDEDEVGTPSCVLEEQFLFVASSAVTSLTFQVPSFSSSASSPAAMGGGGIGLTAGDALGNVYQLRLCAPCHSWHPSFPARAEDGTTTTMWSETESTTTTDTTTHTATATTATNGEGEGGNPFALLGVAAPKGLGIVARREWLRQQQRLLREALLQRRTNPQANAAVMRYNTNLMQQALMVMGAC